MRKFDCEKCLHKHICYRLKITTEKSQLEIQNCKDYKDETLFNELLSVRGIEAFKIKKDCDGCKHFDDDWLYGEECGIDKRIYTVDFDKGCKYKIIPIRIYWENLDDYGKTIWLSTVEAENKLKEMG